MKTFKEWLVDHPPVSRPRPTIAELATILASAPETVALKPDGSVTVASAEPLAEEAYIAGAREMRKAAAKECTDLSHTARFIMDGVAMRECAAAIRAIEVEEE